MIFVIMMDNESNTEDIKGDTAAFIQIQREFNNKSFSRKKILLENCLDCNFKNTGINYWTPEKVDTHCTAATYWLK